MIIESPNIYGGTQEEQVQQIRNYLFRLNEQLNYALTELESSGGSSVTGQFVTKPQVDESLRTAINSHLQSASAHSRVISGEISKHNNDTTSHQDIRDAIANSSNYTAGNGISIVEGTISVDMADSVEQNNTKPVSSGTVYSALQGIGGSGDSPSLPSIVDAIYPVGSIYMSVNATSPATLFGGTWESLESKFLVGASAEYPSGSMGGAKYHNHTLSNSGYAKISMYKTEAKIGQATLSKSSAFSADRYATVSAAPTSTTTTMNTATPLGGTTDTNWNTLPPYLSVYMWKRTA